KINIRSQYYSSDPLVNFSFDDAAITDLTRFKPIFDAQGITGSICVITDRLNHPEHLSLEQLKKLKAEGWSVASHLKSHANLREISLEQAEEELRESQKILKKHGLDYDILVYPFGG